MNQPQDKPSILRQSAIIFDALTSCAVNIPDNIFFLHPGTDTWSVAENIQHLITSQQRTTLVYRLPKFILRLVAGKPNRASHSYEELTAKYRLKLQKGGKATGRYIPKQIAEGYSRKNLLHEWQQATASYLKVLDKYWKEEQLDACIAPHPLLGKITLRELCYFTIYHTGQHLNIIKSR